MACAWGGTPCPFAAEGFNEDLECVGAGPGVADVLTRLVTLRGKQFQFERRECCSGWQLEVTTSGHTYPIVATTKYCGTLYYVNDTCGNGIPRVTCDNAVAATARGG